jgi:hypothetical protein
VDLAAAITIVLGFLIFQVTSLNKRDIVVGREASRRTLAPAARRSGVVYPRIVSTDLNGFMCKTPLAVRASGVAAQRITSSAWNRRVGGMVRPSAWAVFRLMTNSNLTWWAAPSGDLPAWPP